MTPTLRQALRPAALLALLLATGCGKGNESTAPTGDNTGEHLVIFATDRARPAGDHGLALYDFDAPGFRGMPNLDATGSESDPCLSNDGNFVAFAAVRGSGSTGSDLYVYDRLNQGLLPTPNLNTTLDESWPRFTYDSVKLAFVRRLGSGEKRVRLYEPLGDTLVPLTGLDAGSGFNDDMPAPDLDGSRIAFASDRTGSSDVLLWNRAGGLSPRASLASSGDDTEPSLSADGRWLAFASDRSGGAGGHDVYLYDVTGDSLVVLPGLNSSAGDRHPAVSANGDVIVFQSDRSGSNDLYQYVRSTRTLSQPAAFVNPSDDIQPYLRWR
jgi:Tol biopolymer transport system component